ncbi:helix-turn-helix transcriptional regulator [Paenibacillus spongiae]|uniref:AraC family transcriptional regulator n=1 Tax=Paenibacillus spongiae TaxID=2909671 RepID=A0ABY5S3S5_9BACL|nr:AraC family transcriptional regulator [Paenibacillus spongiae]UVI28561.1 AraC family transcriptional regulator [Paenibacillus spongiae]
MEGDSLFLSPPVFIDGFAIEKTDDDPFVFPLHRHDSNSELLLIIEGEGAFGIDGRTYKAKAGTMLFYHRGVWHEERSIRHPFKALFLAFNELQLRGLPADYFLDPGRPPIIELKEHYLPLRQWIQDILAEYRQRYPEAQSIATHMLGILFARLARLVYYPPAPVPDKRPSHAAVPTAKRYMEENYYTDITLATLAKLTYVNEYHLAHLFKDEVGISPIQYLIQCRMEVAKRYLQTTGLPLRDIAERVGYKSETSFLTLFKRMTGTTPGKYRSMTQQPPDGQP